MGLAEKIGALRGWRQLLLAFAAGALLATVQVPWSFPPAYFLAIPVLFRLHRGAPDKRRAALLGWMAGLAYFGLTLSWLVEPFMVEARTQGWMAPFALFFMAAGLALFWALAFGLARRGSIAGFAGLWMLAELVRSYIFTGFAWGLIAQGWIDTPLIQSAALVGVHGLGLLSVVGVLLLARGTRGAVALGLGVFALLWGYGIIRESRPVYERETPFTVRLVQPNAAQELKWLPEFQPVFFDRQLALTAEGDSRPDLVIWPEAAVPFLPDTRPDLRARMAAAAKGSRIAFGARRRDEAGRWFNALFLLDPAGEIVARYDKQHLVPFGEYIPLSGLLEKTGIGWLKGLTGTGFSAGDGPVVIKALPVPAFVPLICYEAVFPQDVQVAGQRAEWLLQITNDAWFGKFSGPYQHLAQARIRAIEQGLPLARAANTGVSAVIGPYGRIRAMLPLNVAGKVDAPLPAPLEPTLYSRTQDWGILAVLLLLTFYQYFRDKSRTPVRPTTRRR